jgi:hypothetical protein
MDVFNLIAEIAKLWFLVMLAYSMGTYIWRIAVIS